MFPSRTQGLDKNLVFTMTEGASHVAYIGCQVVDNDGNNINEQFIIDLALSTSGTALVPDNAPQANFDERTAGTTYGYRAWPASATTSIFIRMVTNASGYCEMILTDSGDVAYWVAGVVPGSGRIVISDDAVDYGA